MHHHHFIYILANIVHGRLTLHTSHTSIIKVAKTEIICSNSLTSRPWTVNKSCLSSSTQQIIQKDGASAMAKVGIAKYYST